MRTVQKEVIRQVIVKREARAYKGDFGRLLLIGGTYPYGGAIIMAAIAAVHSGAGLVTVATDPDNLTALHSHLPEAMGFDLADQDLLREQIQKADVILVGPGLKESNENQAVLQMIFEQVSSQQVLILDGGAISLFSTAQFDLPEAQLVFTPHQKEWDGSSKPDGREKPKSSRELSQRDCHCRKRTPHTNLDKWDRRGISARCWRSLSGNRRYGRYLSRDDRGVCRSISTGWAL